jgi:ribosome-binding factor A
VAALDRSLNHAAGFFSQALGRTLTTHKTPRLHFVYDRGFDYAEEMEQVLKQVSPPDE